MHATYPPAPAGALSIPEREMDLAERIAFGFLASYPPITRNTYRIALRQWFTWCHARGLDVLAAERMHVEVWLRYLQEQRGLKGSTACGKLVAVTGFYKSAVMDGHLTSSPALYVRRPKVDDESNSTWLNRTQVHDLLQEAKRARFYPLRDYALCCFYFYNGMRASEAVGVDLDDLGRQGVFNAVRILRKGGNSQTLPFNPYTAWAIEELVNDHHEHGRHDGPLFITKGGKRCTRNDGYWIVRNTAQRAGLNRKGLIHPHSLRHSFATLSLDAGASIRDVQQSGGWKTPTMPNWYDRRRESLDRNSTHPLGGHVEGAA
jgi:site-specific recombinase XerD